MSQQSQTPASRRVFAPRSNPKAQAPPRRAPNVSPTPPTRTKLFSSPSNSQDSVKTLGRSQVSRPSQAAPQTPNFNARPALGTVTPAARTPSSQMGTPRATPVVVRRSITNAPPNVIEEEGDLFGGELDEFDVDADADAGEGGEESESQQPEEDGDVRTYEFNVPGSLTQDEVQQAINDYINKPSEGAKKRRYDSTKLGAYFTNGRNVWSACNRLSRISFARYLQVRDKDIHGIISTAAGTTVNEDSDEYSAAYLKILEWRKNWFHSWMIQAESVVRETVQNNLGYSQLDNKTLTTAYSKLFSYELLFKLTNSSVASMVDWRATLQNQELYAMYKTIVTYTLLYIHQWLYSTSNMSRTKCLELVRLVPLAPAFEHIASSSIILLGPKPVSRLRSAKRVKPQMVTDLDPDFVAFTNVDEDELNRVGNPRGGPQRTIEGDGSQGGGSSASSPEFHSSIQETQL